jgi:hypothetical protein
MRKAQTDKFINYLKLCPDQTRFKSVQVYLWSNVLLGWVGFYWDLLGWDLLGFISKWVSEQVRA